jgi:hypothetical protein
MRLTELTEQFIAFTRPIFDQSDANFAFSRTENRSDNTERQMSKQHEFSVAKTESSFEAASTSGKRHLKMSNEPFVAAISSACFEAGAPARKTASTSES